MFEFLDPGRLVDGDLMLILDHTTPADPLKAYVPAYHFKMVHTGTGEEVGQIDLRVGNTPNLICYGGHFGYAVVPAHRGHHYAARACRLLLSLAQRHGLETIWITCNPENIASRRTCELLGAVLVEIVDLPEDIDMYQEGERQKCRYRLDLPGGKRVPRQASCPGSEDNPPPIN